MFEHKRTFIIILTIVFVIIFSTVFAVNISHFAPEYGVTTANVNLRNAPNTSYSSFIRTLEPNTKIKIVGTVDNYYIIQLETNEVGIISKDYAKITGNSITANTYIDYAPFYGTIKGDNTIIRGGPSTSFRVNTKLNSGDRVYVIGAIDNFLLVVTDNNVVGMVRQDLVEYTNNTTTPETTTQENDNNNVVEEQNNNESKANAQYILSRINTIRNENGLPNLILDDLITSTAQTKSEDMVKNNYFSHTSPTYGTPFEMLQNAGVTYKTAGENIAGNSNIDEAIDSFMSSSTHSQNILSNSYNYIGIGISPSDKYGYVITLMFVGRY